MEGEVMYAVCTPGSLKPSTHHPAPFPINEQRREDTEDLTSHRMGGSWCPECMEQSPYLLADPHVTAVRET